VARYAGLADGHLEAVRQAIGEACSRAVARHLRSGSGDLVRVVITDGDMFEVRVVDHAGDAPEGVAGAEDEEGAFADETALALLKGLVERFSLSRLADGGSEITMAWPLSSGGRPKAGSPVTNKPRPGM
jgi:hypothetical protein